MKKLLMIILALTSFSLMADSKDAAYELCSRLPGGSNYSRDYYIRKCSDVVHESLVFDDRAVDACASLKRTANHGISYIIIKCIEAIKNKVYRLKMINRCKVYRSSYEVIDCLDSRYRREFY